MPSGFGVLPPPIAEFADTITSAFGIVNEVAGLDGFNSNEMEVLGTIVHTLKFVSSFAMIVTGVPPLTVAGNVVIIVPFIIALPSVTVKL